MKYAIDFNIMEMVQLVYACNYALGKERNHFVQIFEYNCKAREALENVKQKIFEVMHDNCHIELDLMEMVQLYSACNMAWHHEKDEMEKQHADHKRIQYAQAVQELEYAREKILDALNKGGK